MSRAPVWATDLLAQVWAAEGAGPVPALGWWRARGQAFSSGRAWPTENRIHVTAGTALVMRGHHATTYAPFVALRRERRRRQLADQRVVLLHEIAHLLTGLRHGAGHHHSEEFWHVAWALFIRYRGDVPLAYILPREASYRQTALHVAVALNIRGARAYAHAAGRIQEGSMPTTTKKPAGKKQAATGDTKHCAGVPGVEGYPAHDAPVGEFAKNAYNKDGLSRKCKVCWPVYVKALKAKKGDTPEATAAADVAADAPAPEAAAEATEAPVQVVDGEPAARRKRVAQERALARVGGAETEEGQALLAQWAAEDKKARADARPRVRKA